MKPYADVPDGLAVTHDDAVLRIRFDRPDRRNALTDAIVYALVDTIDAAGSDESVRVVEITGAGDHFCSGFDLGDRRSSVGGGTADKPRVSSIHRRMHAHVNRLIPAMLESQTPIVCAVQGWCIGLGLDIALAADFTVVAADARLWAPFTTFGFTPDSGASWLIPRLAGVARAKEMLMLAQLVTGADAAAWGLVHRAAASNDELETMTLALVDRLAHAPTVAVGLTKLLIQRGLTADLPRHLHDEAWAMEVSSRSDDFKEYGAASKERRDPDYRGR